MIDTIARTGSCRRCQGLGKGAVSLTYSVRQLETRWTFCSLRPPLAPGKVHRGRRRAARRGNDIPPRRWPWPTAVAMWPRDWETQRALAVDAVIARRTLLEQYEAFYALDPQGRDEPARQTTAGPALRA